MCELYIVDVPTSRAIGPLKKKNKKNMTKFSQFPDLTLTGCSSDAGILCG